jgi:Na+/melibiose symporter-like transporter
VLERLRNGPWWVLAIFAGAMFLVGQIPVVVLVAEGRSPLVGALVALICSVFFGAFFGIVMARLRRRFAPLLEGPDGGQLTPAQRKALGRAALRGPLPVDPAQRQAAARLARVNLDLLRGQRWYAVPVFLVMTVLSAYLAATDSPWYALATALFAGAFAYWLWAYRQVRRRLPLLEAPPGS